MSKYSGSTQVGYADGKSPRYNFPAGLAVDTSGVLYLADSHNEVIRKISSSGLFLRDSFSACHLRLDMLALPFLLFLGDATTLAGTTALGYVDGVGTIARFNNPTDVAVNSVGVVYVADWGNNIVRMISSSGEKFQIFVLYYFS